MFADQGEAADPDYALWGVGISVGLGILLGIFKSTKFGEFLAKLRLKRANYAQVDEAVEIILTKVGIPPALSDFIGDIVAQVLINFNVIDPGVKAAIEEELIKQFDGKSSAEASRLTLIPPKLLVDSTAKTTAIKKFIDKSSAVDLQLAKVGYNTSIRTSRQNSGSAVKGGGA
jgi:hypothetical protein